MPFIPPEEARALAEHLGRLLSGPVKLDLFTQRGPGTTSEETRALLTELTDLSDRIEFAVHDLAGPVARSMRVERTPAIILRGAARGRVRTFGNPAGRELTSLIEDLVDVSRGSTGLGVRTREALAGLARDLHIQVFVSPDCPYCPEAGRLAHQLAVESDRITADVILVNEFPEMAERYAVRGVPKVVVNDVVEFVGAQPEAHFLAEVLRAA
jgi:glutaredoxin-like protein